LAAHGENARARSKNIDFSDYSSRVIIDDGKIKERRSSSFGQPAEYFFLQNTEEYLACRAYVLHVASPFSSCNVRDVVRSVPLIALR